MRNLIRWKRLGQARWVVLVIGATCLLVCFVILTRTRGQLTVDDAVWLAAMGVIVTALERMTARMDKIDMRANEDRENNAEARRTEAEARIAGDQAVTAALTELMQAERTAREAAIAEEREARQHVDEAMLDRIEKWPERCHRLQTACQERRDVMASRSERELAEMRGEVGVLLLALVPDEDMRANLRKQQAALDEQKAHALRAEQDGFVSRIKPLSGGRPVPTHSVLIRERGRMIRKANGTDGAIGQARGITPTVME